MSQLALPSFITDPLSIVGAFALVLWIIRWTMKAVQKQRELSEIDALIKSSLREALEIAERRRAADAEESAQKMEKLKGTAERYERLLNKKYETAASLAHTLRTVHIVSNIARETASKNLRRYLDCAKRDHHELIVDIFRTAGLSPGSFKEAIEGLRELDWEPADRDQQLVVRTTRLLIMCELLAADVRIATSLAPFIIEQLESGESDMRKILKAWSEQLPAIASGKRRSGPDALFASEPA